MSTITFEGGGAGPTRPCPNCGGTGEVERTANGVTQIVPCGSCRGRGQEPLRDITAPEDDELEADRYRTALHRIDEAAARGLLLKNPTESLSTIRALVKRALENLP